MGLMPEKLKYKVIRRKVKYARIEIKSGELRLILPPGLNPQEVISRHRKWITNRFREIEIIEKKAKELAPINRSKAEFEALVKKHISEAENSIGARAKELKFRKMKTRWGSYSPRGNITINTLAKGLPEELIKYIAFHEVAHLVHMNHGKNFYNLLFKHIPRYKEYRSQLRFWSFILNKGNK